MLMPSLFGENRLDDFFSTTFGDTRRFNMMDTDVREDEKEYEVIINIPGVKKEDLKAELKDGYLTIQACTDSSKEEKDEKGAYIRRERYSGSCSRSFYVGNEVTQEEIRAKFEDGTLKLHIPKKEAKPAPENRTYIAIEG